MKAVVSACAPKEAGDTDEAVEDADAVQIEQKRHLKLVEFFGGERDGEPQHVEQ